MTEKLKKNQCNTQKINTEGKETKKTNKSG